MTPTDTRQHITGRILQALAVTAFVLLSTSPSRADSRNEAKCAINQLQQLGTTRKKPDDMGSIEATFSTAEQYLQQNNREMAERYYLLTIQKTRILKLSLTGPALNQEQPLPLQPDNGLQTPHASPTPGAVSYQCQPKQVQISKSRSSIRWKNRPNPWQLLNLNRTKIQFTARFYRTSLSVTPVPIPWQRMTHCGLSPQNWASAKIILFR